MITQTSLLLSLTILLTASPAYAMRIQNGQPLKRSKSENGVISAPNAYKEALDKAVHTKDAQGLTALHVAAQEGDYAMCKDLLCRGASVLEQDALGNSPLHYAVEKNYPQITELIMYGLPVKARKQRVMAFMCSMRRLRKSKDTCFSILSYLPELITGYPRLCTLLIGQDRLTKEILVSSHATPQVELLNLKNNAKKRAYDIAKEHRNSFMCRMTNPTKRLEICNDEIVASLEKLTIEPSENK